jgi:hypothetical protein
MIRGQIVPLNLVVVVVIIIIIIIIRHNVRLFNNAVSDAEVI